jgi:hypothetical protein
MDGEYETLDVRGSSVLTKRLYDQTMVDAINNRNDNRLGVPPLMAVCGRPDDDEAIARVLLENGADVNGGIRQAFPFQAARCERRLSFNCIYRAEQTTIPQTQLNYDSSDCFSIRACPHALLNTQSCRTERVLKGLEQSTYRDHSMLWSRTWACSVVGVRESAARHPDRLVQCIIVREIENTLDPVPALQV